MNVSNELEVEELNERIKALMAAREVADAGTAKKVAAAEKKA